MSIISSKDFFKPHWNSLTLLGAAHGHISYNPLYRNYSTVYFIFICIGYPMHLVIGIFTNTINIKYINIIALAASCVACSAKFFIMSRRKLHILEMQDILDALDQRVQSDAELASYLKMCGSLSRIRNMFAFSCGGLAVVSVLSLISVVVQEDRNLLYPSWFPFDWRNSALRFYLANIYQCIGMCYLLLQSFTCDSFPAMALCLLSGHIKLLGMRIAAIGHLTDRSDGRNKESHDDQLANEIELKLCIVDHQHLFRINKIIEETSSMTVFLQFAVTAINVCMVMVSLLFFVESAFDRAFNLGFLGALQCAMYPTCYYGDLVTKSFQDLLYDAMASNWLHQNRNFKKMLMLLMQRCLAQQIIRAGGLMPLCLNTFIVTCKAAYSLSAIFIDMDE